MAAQRDSRGRFISRGGRTGPVRDSRGRFIKGGGFVDYSADVVATIVRELEESVARTTVRMHDDINKTLSVSQPPKRSKKTGIRYGTDPSSPGQPPKQVTGTLQGELAFDVAVEPRQIVGRVGYRRGSPASYAIHLELGTRRMAARPFLRPGLDRARGDFTRRLRELRGRLR